MRTWMCVVVAAAVAGPAGAGGGAGDAEDIRGDWMVVSARATRGFDPDEDIAEFKGAVWTFGEAELRIARGKAQTKLQYRLDPAANPKQIDLGKDLRGKGEDRPDEGIYKLEGDKLTICYVVLNGRPSDFSMGRGIAVEKRLVVLERVRK